MRVFLLGYCFDFLLVQVFGLVSDGGVICSCTSSISIIRLTLISESKRKERHCDERSEEAICLVEAP